MYLSSAQMYVIFFELLVVFNGISRLLTTAAATAF